MTALARIDAPRAVRFDPDARTFEAFRLGTEEDEIGGTKLRDPLAATTRKDALAEVTSRWSWDRGDRLGLREIGGRKDLLHVYAVRRASSGHHVWNGYIRETHYAKSLEHIATIDLNIVAGIDIVGVGFERDLFERRQSLRPAGARLARTGK